MTGSFLKRCKQRGSVLLLVLISVTLFGFMAAIAGTSWQTIMQRHKEEELLWRGGQIRSAIGRYYNFKPSDGTPLSQFPPTLDDLLLDSRAPEPIKHLRKLYTNPFSDHGWDPIMSPRGGVMGVFIDSEDMPFKRYGFKEEDKSFNGQLRYKDWHFLWIPTKTVPPKPPTIDEKNSSLNFGAKRS